MRDKCANLDIRGVTDPFMLATEWLGLRGWARISRRTRIPRELELLEELALRGTEPRLSGRAKKGL